MRPLFAFAAAFGMLTAALAAPTVKEEPKNEDAKKIEGDWTFTAFEQAGNQFAGGALSAMKWNVKGDKYTYGDVDAGGEEGTIKLDATKKPGHVDLTITEGMDKGKSQPGIYKIEKDEIVFCLARPGGTERPTEFKSTAENGFILVKLKKKKRED